MLETTMKLVRISTTFNQSNGEKKELNIMIRKADGLNTVQPEVEYY